MWARVAPYKPSKGMDKKYMRLRNASQSIDGERKKTLTVLVGSERGGTGTRKTGLHPRKTTRKQPFGIGPGDKPLSGWERTREIRENGNARSEQCLPSWKAVETLKSDCAGGVEGPAKIRKQMCLRFSMMLFKEGDFSDLKKDSTGAQF